MTSQKENPKDAEVRIDDCSSEPLIPDHISCPYAPFREGYDFSPEDAVKREEILKAVKELWPIDQYCDHPYYEPPIIETAQLALFTPNVVFGTPQYERKGLICKAYKSNKVRDYLSDNRIGIKVGAYSRYRSRDGKTRPPQWPFPVEEIRKYATEIFKLLWKGYEGYAFPLRLYDIEMGLAWQNKYISRMQREFLSHLWEHWILNAKPVKINSYRWINDFIRIESGEKFLKQSTVPPLRGRIASLIKLVLSNHKKWQCSDIEIIRNMQEYLGKLKIGRIKSSEDLRGIF